MCNERVSGGYLVSLACVCVWIVCILGKGLKLENTQTEALFLLALRTRQCVIVGFVLFLFVFSLPLSILLFFSFFSFFSSFLRNSYFKRCQQINFQSHHSSLCSHSNNISPKLIFTLDKIFCYHYL